VAIVCFLHIGRLLRDVLFFLPHLLFAGISVSFVLCFFLMRMKSQASNVHCAFSSFEMGNIAPASASIDAHSLIYCIVS
jgi:hypothetical protein